MLTRISRKSRKSRIKMRRIAGLLFADYSDFRVAWENEDSGTKGFWWQ